MRILYVSYKIFRSLINTVMKHARHDSNEIWNQSENVSRTYETFTVIVYLAIS